MLFPMLNVLYFYFGTFRSMCAVSIMAVFCSSLILCFPGMLRRLLLLLLLLLLLELSRVMLDTSIFKSLIKVVGIFPRTSVHFKSEVFLVLNSISFFIVL
jgi:hypothetical protein